MEHWMAQKVTSVTIHSEIFGPGTRFNVIDFATRAIDERLKAYTCWRCSRHCAGLCMLPGCIYAIKLELAGEIERLGVVFVSHAEVMKSTG
jgi:hypothetical protein